MTDAPGPLCAVAGLEGLFDGMLEPGAKLVLADGLVEAPSGVQGFGLCLLHAARSLLEQGAGKPAMRKPEELEES